LIIDYPEEIKWAGVVKKFKLFESSPASFGKDLRAVVNSTYINDISPVFVPTECESKLSFFKEKYWKLSNKYYHPISGIHFLTCCYLGKPVADKFLMCAIGKYIEVGINPNYNLHLSSQPLESDLYLIGVVNKVCDSYTNTDVGIEYGRTIKRLLHTVAINKEAESQLLLWTIRNQAIRTL
jgi:hypothetical protein